MFHSDSVDREPFVKATFRERVSSAIGTAMLLILAGCGGSFDDSTSAVRSGTVAGSTLIGTPAKSAESPEQLSLDGLAEGILRGEGASLAEAYRRSMAMPNRPEVTPPAPTTSEIASWKRVIQACSQSLASFDPEARNIAMRTAGRVLILTARDQVAVNWSDILDPVREVLALGTGDSDCEVRAAAIDQIALIWDWVPGRDIFTVERNTLAAWKGGMLQLVQPHLKDTEIPSRLAAMRCLAALPIDTAAAPALELLQDSETFVRAETIRYFALRGNLISEEQLLKLAVEEKPLAARSAELALKSRGLTDDQIALGKSILDKDPQVRVSVIEKLDESMDIDPGIWLARLVEDSDASVRLKAIEAVAKRKVSRELLRRLQVISETDSSDAVRKSAEQVLRAQSTASLDTSGLPPLPTGLLDDAGATQSKTTIRAN